VVPAPRNPESKIPLSRVSPLCYNRLRYRELVARVVHKESTGLFRPGAQNGRLKLSGTGNDERVR